MLRVVSHPVLDQHGSFAGVKLGAQPPRRDTRTLQLARYLDDAVLPSVPTSYDLTKAVPSWPMYGNDRLGDCTIAAAGHMIQAWSAAAAGKPKTLTEQDVEAAYWATGKGDTGRVEIDVLNYWRNHGVGGDRIEAYVSVDPRNHAHMKAAIYLFGGVYVGIALPLSAQTQTRWHVVAGPDARAGSWGGHAVPFLAYTLSSFKCVTWGHTLPLTWGFNEAYTEEAYAILSTDFFAAGKTPAGFDVQTLRTDLAAL